MPIRPIRRIIHGSAPAERVIPRATSGPIKPLQPVEPVAPVGHRRQGFWSRILDFLRRKKRPAQKPQESTHIDVEA